MSTAVLPTLKGKTFDVVRIPMWNTKTSQFLSGKEIRINNGWTYPRYQWDVKYEFLRSDTTNAELQSLLGFYNARNGSYDSFLYADSDDNAVTSQLIATGNGALTSFQLVKSFGGFVEPVFAPNVVTSVFVGGVDKVGFWSVSSWGSATPGILTFTGGFIPSGGQSIVATFSYYYPCRFVDDKISLSNFMYQLWDCRKLSFISIK